jgi:hypothetical protein
MSERLARLTVWLSGLLCFREVAQVLQDVGGIDVSTSSVWREVQRRGQHLRAVAEDTTYEAAQGGPAASRMGCSMDGGMMYVRGEGWKELKIGDVFDVEVQQATDVRTGEPIEMGHAIHDTYVAHLGGPEQFGQLLWHTAKQRGWTKASATVVVADGAAWIWNQVGTHFYDSQQVIDWYHACQHLSAAAEALYGAETDAARHCMKKWHTPLYQGQAKQLGQMLLHQAARHPAAAATLQREAGYFLHHHRRMQYMQMREGGWPIGSGMVESGCKQFKHRFAGPGMRWSRSGAERLLPIRAAIMSCTFDALWQRAHSLPPN